LRSILTTSPDLTIEKAIGDTADSWTFTLLALQNLRRP
jgi:hypothetical protein